MLTPLRSSLVLVLLALAVVLVSTPGAAQAKAAKFPSISKVTPMKAAVGGTLTVRGTNFRRGTRKNTVVFKRSKRRPVFVRAGRSSTRTLSVQLPQTLNTLMTKRAGKLRATTLRVRVISYRFGQRYTTAEGSPSISPEPDCNGDGTPDSRSTDDDDDLLPDTLEAKLGTDACSRDTDGDGVPDGFEYHSARDLNGGEAVAYPGKQPYPNPLDKEDAGIDHDGDGLSLAREAQAWGYTGSPFPLSYSDGNAATSGEPIDGLKDVDRDGLDNYTEVAGPLSGREWWADFVADAKCDATYVESPYPGPRYAGLNFVDPDTDGDGILDGLDDIDHDGVSNAVEGAGRPANWCTTYVSVGPGGSGHPGTDPYARVDPFNPCKPVYSQACHRFVPQGYYANSDTYTEDWMGPPPSR